MLPAFIVSLSFLAGALGALAALTPAADTAVSRRLRNLRRYNGETAIDEELTLPFTQRVLAPLVEGVMGRLAGMLPQAIQEQARLRLAQAGVHMDATRFVGIQLTTAAGGIMAALLMMLPLVLAGQLGLPLVLGMILALLGWRMPGFWLARLAAARKRGMEKALPDVMDLLSVSVEAGLGFDGAVQKVAEKFPEPVSGEFREFLKEVRLGLPRAEALRNLAERSGAPDLRTFVAAVIQADQLGVSLAKVLKAQSEAMRVKRKQRAEEKAMQLPLKLLFPLILFIFPTLFIVILGPVAIAMLAVFKAS